MRFGLDFGTCYTTAAVMGAKGAVAQLGLAEEADGLMPTCMLLQEGGHWLFGTPAENAAMTNPRAFRREFKRNIGQRHAIKCGDSSFRPEQLVALFLGEVRRHVAASRPALGARVVLTVPATFQGPRRRAMLKAASEAGFERADILLEPVAVAIDHFSGKRPKPGTSVLVYDLGGGTFDAAIVRITEGGWELLAAGGLAACGGIDLDRAIWGDLVEHLSEEQRRLIDPANDEIESLRAQLAVRDFVREIKHALSGKKSVGPRKVPIPGGPSYKLTSEKLFELAEPLLERSVECCRQVMADNDIKPESIGLVLLSGATCRLPFVAEYVGRELGIGTKLVDEPKLAVARGAARRGGELDEIERTLGAEARGLIDKQLEELSEAIADRVVAEAIVPALQSWRERKGIVQLSEVAPRIEKSVKRVLDSKPVKKQLAASISRLESALRARATELIAPICAEHSIDGNALSLPPLDKILTDGPFGEGSGPVVDQGMLDLVGAIVAAAVMVFVVGAGPLGIIVGIIAALFGTAALSESIAGADLPIFARKLLFSENKIAEEGAKAKAKLKGQLAESLRAEGPFAVLPARMGTAIIDAFNEACEESETSAQRAS